MKWITRERVKVDRVACPWLIKKFVDKDAEFIFVPADKVSDEAKRLDAIPYDVKNSSSAITGKSVRLQQSSKNTDSRAIRRLSCLGKSSTAPIPTIRSTISLKDRGSKRSPRDFAISDTRTITP